MQHSFYEDKLGLIMRHNQMLKIITFGLVASMLLCLTVILTRHTTVRTIVLPSNGASSYWIESGRVSENYVSDMSEYILYLYLTMSDVSRDKHADTLLKLAAPSSQGELVHQLKNEGDRVHRENMITVFYPQEVSVESDNLSAVVNGRLDGFNARERVLSEQLSYRVKFTLNQGRLWLVAIEKNSEDKHA